ncbi:hypothetical protein NE237_021877 [Protea cynaroides]|uniref:Uncharacterized protein n=1 Tax=Protea cynaroides TaxID=273540 RepID=A0A9Q0K3Y9_9MAGN|nr:hypothetical protein NE237_021877 [Protea cynaroides]
MATEAEIPEPIQSNKIGEKDKESTCGESESFKEIQKVEGEHQEVVTNVNNDIVSSVVERDVGICEGESFLVSPSLAKVAIENTCIASESTVVDEKINTQQEMLDNETQWQKDLKQEAVEEAYGGITEAENFNALVKEVPPESGLQSDVKPAKFPESPSEKNVEEIGLQKGETEDPPLNIDEGNETQKNVVILGQEVETLDGHASAKELPNDIEKMKVVNHSHEDEIEGKQSSKESELELQEQVQETSKGTTDQNQEALPFTPDLIGEILETDVRNIREASNDASRDDAPIKQEEDESGFEGIRCKEQENPSDTEGKGTDPTIVDPVKKWGQGCVHTTVKGTDPTIVDPSEKIWEKKQEGHENPQDNNTDSVLKGEESSKIQNGEEIINNSEGTNEKFHTPPTKFITEETSLDKSEQETENIQLSSSIALEERNKQTEDSNETLKDVNPTENKNPNDDLEVTKETRLDESEQEAGKLEETSGSDLEEKSQETIDSNEKMKDENPVEYEISGTEDLESPLVTQKAEGSHFQEQEKPNKIDEISEIESVIVGKDNCSEAKPHDKLLEAAESTISKEAATDETKLDTSITDEEGLGGLQSEKLIFPLTNASIDENKNREGASVTETEDNTEVPERIGAEENCRWQMPKDVEASEQNLQTDKPDEEKLERSLSESVEPAASSADAERSTCEKEEESVNSVEESSKEERKERNINWDDEVTKQRALEDENLRAFNPSQKIENMEVETPHMELGNSPVTHSLVEETIKQLCEQQEEVSNLEVEEQIHEKNRNALVENKHIEEAFKVKENMESTMSGQEKARDGPQTLELIPQTSELQVEETVKVCELDLKEKSAETDASQKREEETEKNEASEMGMSKTVREGEVEKKIIMEECCIPDQGTVFLRNKTDNQNSQVEEKKATPEFSGEEQSCKTNDTDKGTKNEIISKEDSAENKIADVEKETEKHIIEESTIMAHSTEPMKEPLKKSSQENQIMKKHEEEIHKGPHTECEVLEESSTGENTERQTVIENPAVQDHPSSPIQEETATESTQEDEVSQRPETTGIGTTVKGSSEEDEKEEEKPIEFIDSEMGILKNMEDTNKNTEASSVTEASREEMLQKEHSDQFALCEEKSKEDLEKAENNNEKLEAESARTLQEAEQEGNLLEAGSNLASEKSSFVTTETSSTSFRQVDVKSVKLEETHNRSDNAEKTLNVEKQEADEENKGKECEMQLESSDTVIGFQYKGIETSTGTEITAREASLDNIWEKTRQGSSTMAPKGQEVDSIEKGKEIKDESPMQQNNLEFSYLANSTGEISIQKEEPGKLEDVSKMSTNEIGKESFNEELQETDSAKEKKLSESPEKNTFESKDADEILKREEDTELTKLGKNSRTETLKDESKLQESPEEGELDGEKTLDVVSKGVETSSSCASIEKDVLDKEDMGIKLEAVDQSHERKEGLDPRESTALKENTEDVDTSQTLERACEVVADDQSHETHPGAKENKVKEDNSVVEDQNTASLEEQMIMQRLQEAEKDGMNLEDIRNKLETEHQTGKEDIPNETTKTAVLNELPHSGHDKAETSENISKWSIEEESTAKDLYVVSIEDRIVNEVQDVLLSVDMCTQEIDDDDDVETETLNLKTVEYPTKEPEASPITEVLEGDIIPRLPSANFLDISKSVPEASEELTKEYIFKEAETTNDELSIASFTAITEEMSSPQNELESGKLEGASDIGSEEKCQRTVETGSMDEEVKEVKLAQTPDSVIIVPTEGDNAHKEKSKTLEKIDPYEVEEVKRSSNAISASEYQAVKAITEAETPASQPADVKESEENLQEPSVSEQELGNKTTNQKIRDEMLKEDEPLRVKNSVGPFTLEETENMCLQRNEPKELEEASKMGFQDIEKGIPSEEQEEKGGPKLDEASQLDSELPACAAKDDESFLEREINTELNKASHVCIIETSEEENANLVSDSQKEESEGKKLEIPFNKMNGEHDEDGEKVNTEKYLLEKDDHVISPEETLKEEANASDTKEKAEISHFISEEQEKETPASLDKIDTSKIKDEADKDLDASPTPNSLAVEATKEEAFNEHQEVTQLVPHELIHGINGTNEENREGAAEDKNVVKELIEVQKPNNTLSNLVSNSGDIVEDLPATGQEFPTNDSNISSFTEASQEQASEKGSQMTEDDEGLTLEFTTQETGEVNLPKEVMEGDPVIDEGAVKESSNKEVEKMNNDRNFHETNANEEGETPIPGHVNMAVFSSVEQATTERSFKDNTEEHDRTTNVVIKGQDLYLPFVGEETVKYVRQDKMEDKTVDEIATKSEDEDNSQALGTIEDQGEKINAVKETPNRENLDEDVSEELDKADASENWGEQIKEEIGMVNDSFVVSMGEETCKECHHEDEKDGNKVNDTEIKQDLEDRSQELDAEEYLKDKANEANKILKCENFHEEVFNGIEDDGSSEKMERQVTEEEALKDQSLASIKEEMIREDQEGEKKDSHEVKSSDVISELQQLEQTYLTDEVDTSTIKGEADKDLSPLPTTNSPAAEATEKAVKEPQEVTQPVPKGLIHEINETRADNIEGAAEDKNVMKEFIAIQKPNNTTSILLSNPVDNVEDLHPTDQEVPTNDSNASSFTETSQEKAPEKRSQTMEDEEGKTSKFSKPATTEVNLAKEAMEGDPVKDEGGVKESSNKEEKMMNNDRYFHETKANEEGETPIPGQESMAIISSAEQAAAERSFKDKPKNVINLVIEEQNQIENHHPQCIDERATELEVEDNSQTTTRDQKEKANAVNETLNCEILNEDVSEGPDVAGASATKGKQIIEETGMVKDPSSASIGEVTYKESQHGDEKEGNKVNDPKTKLEREDQTQKLDAEEIMKDNENEVSTGFENAESSERMERQMTEEEPTKDLYLVPIKEETFSEGNEEEKGGQKVENIETKLNPRDQNQETSCKDDVTENIINREVKSSDVVLEEQQLETPPSTNEADKDLDASPPPNSPAEKAPEDEAVNEPKEVTQLVPKNLIHEINKTNEENKKGDTVEDLHPNVQEVQTNNSNVSPHTEYSQERIPEKEGHMTEDEERHNLVILKQATGAVNLPTEKTEGDSIKDEVQAQDTLYKECENTNYPTNVQETKCGYEEEETPLQEQEDTVFFSSVEQATAEKSIKDSLKDHNTTTNLVIEEQSLLKDPYEECVGEETVKKAHQEKKEGKRVDEITTELDTKDNVQTSEAIEDQTEKIIETSDASKCEILNEEVSKGLEKVGTTDNIEKENMEENRTVKDPCEVSIEEEACKEHHHEDKKERKSVNDREIKVHLEDQSQEGLAGEDLEDMANESNKNENHEALCYEVSPGTENAGSSEKIEKNIIEDEAMKNTFLASIGEETTKKSHQEEEKVELEVEKEANDLDPKDQNHETSSQHNATENCIPDEKGLETTASTDKMDIMTIKEDLDVSSTPNTADKEAPVGEAVYEPQEAPHHEHTELIQESIKMNEENTESTTEEKIVAKEFTEAGKLKTTSSDLISHASNIVEDLHPKDQEESTNKSNALSLTEASQGKTPEKEANMTEDEERNSLVTTRQEKDQTSLATGEMEGYPINNEAPVQEILLKEAKEMNDADANIANRGGETPVPKWQGREILSSTEQAVEENNNIRDSPDVPDTTGDLVFEEQSHEIQRHETEKTEGQNLKDADTLNEKVFLSDVQPSDRELPQKVESLVLPEVIETSPNIVKIEKAADATTEESTQTKVQTAEKDIPSVPQHSILKSKQGDEVEDQKPGEALGTESIETGVEYSGDTTMGDVKPMHKKSHNILSGVGSKVKHSIAKVKKAIACTHPHTDSEPPSPK